MTCRQAEPLFNALADHELNPWQAARVRRHLAACRACAAEYAAIQRLGASVQAWRDVLAPSGLGQRIAAALPPSVSAPAPRERHAARRAAVGLAGVAAATGIGFWLLPGKPSQPTIALADVEQAMENVKTMSFVNETIKYDASGKVVLHLLDREWIRRDPPAVATINLLNPFQPGEMQDREMLEDGRGSMAVMPDGSYSLSSSSQDVAETVSGKIGLCTQYLQLVAQENAQSGKKELIGSQRTILDGQSAVQLKVTLHIHKPTLEDEYLTIWINEKTLHMMRIEGEIVANGKRVIQGSSTDFRYDETPPPGVFDIVPPPGARVVDQRPLRVYRQP